MSREKYFSYVHNQGNLQAINNVGKSGTVVIVSWLDLQLPM